MGNQPLVPREKVVRGHQLKWAKNANYRILDEGKIKVLDCIHTKITGNLLPACLTRGTDLSSTRSTSPI